MAILGDWQRIEGEREREREGEGGSEAISRSDIPLARRSRRRREGERERERRMRRGERVTLQEREQRKKREEMYPSPGSRSAGKVKGMSNTDPQPRCQGAFKFQNYLERYAEASRLMSYACRK